MNELKGLNSIHVHVNCIAFMYSDVRVKSTGCHQTNLTSCNIQHEFMSTYSTFNVHAG